MPKRYYLLLIVILVLATYLTVASTRYTWPAPCPPAGCAEGRLHAGWPIVVYQDNLAESPTSRWGVLGPEDFLVTTFMLSVLCYSLPLGLLAIALRYAFHAIRRRHG
jgi:hypothetical protein